MLVVGWRTGANPVLVSKVLRKHTDMDLKQVKKTVDDIFDGKTVKLPDHFLLIEDLAECKLILK